MFNAYGKTRNFEFKCRNFLQAITVPKSILFALKIDYLRKVLTSNQFLKSIFRYHIIISKIVILKAESKSLLSFFFD